MIEILETGENETVEVCVGTNYVSLYKSNVSEEFHIELSIEDWFKVTRIVNDITWGKQ